MKINFSTVLMDLPDSKGVAKPLKLLVEQGRVSDNGLYVIKEPTYEDMTLGGLILSQIRANDEEKGEGMRRSNFGLLVRIAQMGVVDIEIEERNMIVRRLAKAIRDDVTFGAADALLNPQPHAAGEKSA